MRPWSRGWSHAWLLAGLVALLAHLGLPAAQDPLYLLIGVAGVAAVGVGAHRHGATDRWAWWLIAAGLGSFVIGDAIWFGHDVAGAAVVFPSTADVAYLAGYPLIAAGLLRMAWRRGLSGVGLVDALVLALAVAAAGWFSVILPLMDGGAAPPLTRLVALAYPLGSFLLLAPALALLLTGGLAVPATRWLTAALALQLLGDGIYAHLSLSGGYASGELLDLTWLGAYALIGAAALHPSMRELTQPAPRLAEPLTPARFLLLVSATLAVPVTDWVVGIQPHNVGIATSTVLGLVVAVRLVFVVAASSAAATRDGLTGLANRRAVVDRLQWALRAGRDPEAGVALLMCDLDGFKLVNDGLGHAAGDEVLIEVARRLRWCGRPDDLVGRIGGDEFVVVAETLDDQGIDDLARRMLAAVSAPMIVDGCETGTGASIGVAAATPTHTAEALLRDADTALYQAKADGRGRIQVFNEQLRTWAVDRVTLLGDLRTALDSGQLVCEYQPEITLSTGELFAFESLVRWRHPQRGILMPDQFIPVAEAVGLAGEVFKAVLAQTLQAQARWAQVVGHHPAVAVNVSPSQVAEADLVALVTSALAETGAPPESLWLEFTETALPHAANLSTLAALHELGVRLAVDDFGTGWSSVSRLSLLPWDLIKIDRSFTARLTTDDQTQHLVRAMIAMGHALGTQVTAEGVETPQQESLLTRLGCDIGQGYLFAHPTDAARALAHLTHRTPSSRATDPAGC